VQIEQISHVLAFVNACLNAIAGIFVVRAVFAIRRGDRERHRALMLRAVAASCVFLLSYSARMVIAGDTPFQGEGTLRVAYLILLASHVLLAMILLLLVPFTLRLGLKGRFERHRGLARFTFPIWIYVSCTGVLVYVLLYQFPGQP